MEAAGLFGHFADRRRQAAGAVIGDGAVPAEIADFFDDGIGHFFLGYGVTNLNGSGGGAFIKGNGRECCAVDAVCADASACHDDFIAGVGFFDVAGFAVDLSRDQADGADEHEGFSGKAVIEIGKALWCGDAGAIAAGFYTCDDAVYNGFWR